MPVKREIHWPIFLDCTRYCTDIFWENIFEELAYGKAPYGTYISKGFLCCAHKGKEFSYKIDKETEDSQTLYNNVYNLLSKKLEVLSQKEKAEKKVAFYNIEKDIMNSRQDWTSIRRKNIKDILYEKFVIDMKHKYSLNNKQCKYLMSVIAISILFKTISAKDVQYTGEKIESISGITFSKGKIILERPMCVSGGNIGKEVVKDEEDDFYMHKNWNKYTEYLVQQNKIFKN